MNRKDVEVRTRKGYTDETEKDWQAAAEAAKKGDLSSLVDSPLPVSGVPLGIVAAPFPMEDGKPALALTLRIHTPKDAQRPGPRKTEIVYGSLLSRDGLAAPAPCNSGRR